MPVEVREGRVVIRPRLGEWGRGRDAERWKRDWLKEVRRGAEEEFRGHEVRIEGEEVHVVPENPDEETLRRIRERAMILLGRLGLE